MNPSARTGIPYTYQLSATDPENAPLTYELLNPSQLPSGITLNNSGQLTWNNPTVGTYTIAVGVNDGLQGAAQAYTLTVANPVAPVITSTPPTTATPGRTYRYDVRTPNSDTLTYRLENAPNGMTIDSVGRIVWNVPHHATGTVNATIIVTDNFGGQTTQPLHLNLFADTQPPAVRLQPIGNVYTVNTPTGTQYQVDVSSNATVTLRAVATDNLQVDSLQLLVNGTPVAMDANGVATVPVGISGSTLNAVAIAKNTSGNTASQQPQS